MHLKQRRSRKRGRPGAEPPCPRTPAARGEHVPAAAGRAALPEPPPEAQGPARPHPPGSFILNLRLPHPCTPAPAETGFRGRVTASGHNPCPESGPRRDSRAPAASALGWSERPRRPAPKARAPQHRSPTLRLGTGQALPARGAASWGPRIPATRLPHCGRKSPRRPLPSTRLPSPPRPNPLRAASGLLPRAAGRRKRGAAPPGPPTGQEQSREAQAVTLIILRGSPAILSDPEFGLWSRLRLRSPHARVEVPGSTSGGRCRARRRRRRRQGPSGNVVPARARAGFPRPWPPPPRSPPQPGLGGGGSDARGGAGTWGRRRGAARSSGARGRAGGIECSAPRRPLIRGHARARGRRNRGLAVDAAHSSVR